ncbi:uncharacterized protein BXZ73DRAFT_97857 [Epithele typhae]|uniref:uncharacterized protein n=1 Tax=Epithele typhae TaxID=378194 RepID=UPI0020079DDA|nr:uncharacterized protein BXZ73DRAFT_97857 [Epithele typhae]KAH9942447.1 hypothetical protein BXZ73DRAFT_97857 [Epithele typhae]
MPPRKKQRVDATTPLRRSPRTTFTPTKPFPTAPRRRNVRGVLKDMLKMPLDILFEVFALLHPEDLLHLSRTNKAFRQLLLDPAAASFWKAARCRVKGFPAPPPHLSEPSFASLLFSPCCRACGKPGEFPVLVELFTRYCTECEERCLVRAARSQLPDERFSVRKWVNTVRTDGSGPKYRMLLAEAEHIKRRWANLSCEDEKKEYLAERIAFVVQCREHASALRSWLDAVELTKIAERSALKAERYDDDSVTTAGATISTPSNGIPEWQAIRKRAIKILEPHREKRLRDKEDKRIRSNLIRLRKIVKQYQQSVWAPQAGLRFFPGFFELATVPAICSFVRQNPSFDAGDLATEQEVASLLPGLHKRLAAHATSTLAHMVHKALGTDPATHSDVKILQLATSCFQCKTLHNVSESGCMKCEYAFNVESVRTHFIRGVTSRRMIVASYGLNPDRATFTDMDGCGVRLRCKLCRAHPDKLEVFDWEGAILHDVARHHRSLDDDTSHWEPVAAEQATRVCELQDAYMRGLSATSTGRHACTWCGRHTYRDSGPRHDRDEQMTLVEVKKHLLAEGVDYVVDYEPKPAITMFKPKLSKNWQATELVQDGLGFFIDF